MPRAGVAGTELGGVLMYTLYYSPGAASLAVHWLLLELDVPHRLEKIDLDGGQQRSEEYLRLNPNGRVPTLVVDGRPMYECAALMLLLPDRHPDAALAPNVESAERESYYQWMVHLANTLQPAFRAWFYADEPAGRGHEDAVQARARETIERSFDHLDSHLGARGPYVIGTQISAADIYAGMLMRWSRNMPKPATQWPHLAALAKRLKSRDTFKTLYEREGLTDWT
jgi:glutathione S-transferase